MADRRLDADRIFVALGRCGRYQMQAFISTNAAFVFLTLQIMQVELSVFERILRIFRRVIVHDRHYCRICRNYPSVRYLRQTLGVPDFNVAVIFNFTLPKFRATLFSVRRLSFFGWTVLFCNGTCMVGWVISCENLVISMRSALSIVNGMFWSLGFVLLGAIAYFVRSWRLLSVCLSLPIALSAPFYWLVPETLHWYIAVGKHKEAEGWVKKASKCNKAKVNLDECYVMPEDETKLPGSKSKKTLLDILRSNILLPQFLVLCYLWMVDAFLYFGLSLFSRQLSGNRYANFILSGLVELPSWLVAAHAMEKIGRNLTTVVFHFISGITLLSLAFIPETIASGTNLVPLIITVSTISKFSVSVNFMSVFLYVAEVIPTTVRSVGIGWCSVASHAGSILAPYVGYLVCMQTYSSVLQHHVSPVIVPILFATMGLIASPLTLVVPESKGMDLPEDMCDARPSKCQSLMCPCVSRHSSYPKTSYATKKIIA